MASNLAESTTIRKSAKTQFTRKCNQFDDYVAMCKTNDTPLDLAEIEGRLDILKDKYDKLLSAHELYLKFVQLPTEDDLAYLNDSDDRLEKFVIIHKRISLEHSKPQIVVVPKVEQQVINEDKSDCDVKEQDAYKVERIKFEKFDGKNPRLYFDWRKKIQNKFLTKIHKSGHAVAVVGMLEEGALKCVQACSDDDVTEIWKELDRRFGDPRKISALILSDINNTPPMLDANTPGFIAFVDKLRLGYKELGNYSRGIDLNNSIMIANIERKLPPSIKEEWCEKIVDENNSISTDKIFDELLAFLKHKAAAKEYAIDPIRNSASDCAFEMSASSHATMGAASATGYTKNQNFPRGEMPRRVSDPNSKSPCLVHLRDGIRHTTVQCNDFRNKSVYERNRTVLTNRACQICLERGHFAKLCSRSTDKTCTVHGCFQPHHTMLHPDNQNGGFNPANNFNGMNTTAPANQVASTSHYTVPQMMNTTESPTQPDPSQMTMNTRTTTGKTLLPIQSVHVGQGKFINVLHDTASSTSLILTSIAKSLKLESVGTFQLTITKTGATKEKLKADLFSLNLIAPDETLHEVLAFGLNQISSDIEKVSLEQVAQIMNISVANIQRPHGKIELLIGSDNASLHPTAKKKDGNFILGSNQFGDVVWGSHPTVHAPLVEVVHVMHYTKADINDFFQIESMGIQCNPKCGNCRCGKCPLGSKKYTIKEENELAQMKNNLQLFIDHWVTKYSWIKDPKLLMDNYWFIHAQLESLENMLLKDPVLAAEYDFQIMDMIFRNVARPATLEEILFYDGPVFYLGHHYVIKLNSDSTPLRIVFNPSKKFRGFCLNDFWTKGANTVQSLFDVAMRFREFAIAILGDISKFYNSVHTTPLEWHTHRFLWRHYDKSIEPTIYVITRNSFGDKPSGTIATLAVQKTVEQFGAEYPLASKALLEATYVDDISDSQPTIETATKMMKETEELLIKGGFKIKGWTLSEQPTDNNHGLKFLDVDRVLGLHYDSTSDCFTFRVNPSQKADKKSSKKKSLRTRKIEEDSAIVSITDIVSEKGVNLTHRMLLAWVNGIFDPLGLATPFVVKAKILLRKVTMYKDENDKKLDWDDAIPQFLQLEWKEWFNESLHLENVKFPRCISPKENHKAEAILVMFSDASESALGCCAYLRWELDDGSVNVSLVAAKSRVAPLSICTIVRLELQAAIMSKRLAESIQGTLRIKLEKTMYIVDSEIVRAMINKDSYGFNTFVAVRVGEIQQSTKPDQWYWIDGEHNIADWVSRGKCPGDLGPNSAWQRGYEFMYTPIDSWPIQQSRTKEVELPEVKSYIFHTIAVMPKINISAVVDISRFSSLSTLVKVTARIMSMCPKLPRQLASVLVYPTYKAYKSALKIWIYSAQRDNSTGKSIVQKTEAGDLRNLVPVVDDDGIIRVRGRVFSKEELSEPILLPQNHRLSKLIVREIHELNHDGLSTVATKVRKLYWIIGVHKVAKAVSSRCAECKKDKQVTVKQIMSDLPRQRLEIAKPFQYCALDLFGPYELRIPCKATRSRKFTDEKFGYGIIFNCLYSRAVYIDLARGYDVDGFLLVYRRFQTIHGDCDILYSDCGSQLTAADKILHADTFEKWDKNTLLAHGVKTGTEWKFSAPDAPWQNGLSESLIRGVKRSLRLTVGTDHPKLAFDEFQTVLFEIANVLNERPIGRHPTSPDECDYLKPNDLLLGRCSDRIRSGPWEFSSSCKRKRFLLVQEVIDDWHKRWYRDYFPTLVPKKIWHTQNRDIEIGDIVLVQDSNVIRGQWTLAQVCNKHVSADGKVRNVDVRYKVHPSTEPASVYAGSKDKIMKRAVQRLVVILPVEGDVESDSE